MTFPVSPGVYTNEINLTTTIPSLGSTVGALSGIFAWGPVFEPILITSQKQYQSVFGKPSNLNPETWFTGYNFLNYASNLLVVRTGNTTPNTTNSTTVANGLLSAIGNTNTINYTQVLSATILNHTDYQNKLEAGGWNANLVYAAKWPGNLGNTLRVGQCDSATQYKGWITLTGTISNGVSTGNSYNGYFTINPGFKTGQIIITANGVSNIAAGNTWANTYVIPNFGKGDVFQLPTGIRNSPFQYLTSTTIGPAITNATVTYVNVSFTSPYQGSGASNTFSVTLPGGYTGPAFSNGILRTWQYYKQIPSPGTWTTPFQANSAQPTQTDAMQIIVTDTLGWITGIPNTVLEIYSNLSRATDAVNLDGTTNYYQAVINQQSPWIWILNDRIAGFSNTANTLTAITDRTNPLDVTFGYGQDGDNEATAPLATLINGWNYFTNKDLVLIDLVMAGKATGWGGVAGVTNTTYNNCGLADWLINNISNVRKDCVTFFSPDKSVVVNNIGNEAVDLVNWASIITSSNRGFMDSGYKFQYDQFNNVYRWIPLNGDIAGVTAYSDIVTYPWFSPAGFNRGQISNVIKLAYNPNEGERDYIYPQAVNPVVSFPGQGTYLYGDRTFSTQPSAFNRLNVRRLFIYVERAIAQYAKFTLFEQNDVFTQNQFKNAVIPFLSSIQGARGITEFLVVCDGTNNTATVVNGDQFLCAIYIKPEHSINFIRIDYIATPDGVSFNTVEQTSY